MVIVYGSISLKTEMEGVGENFARGGGGKSEGGFFARVEMSGKGT